jgi:gliding motility-associated-like protein
MDTIQPTVNSPSPTVMSYTPSVNNAGFSSKTINISASNSSLTDSTLCESNPVAPCQVEADFALSDTVLCPGDTLYLTNQSVDAAYFNWLIDGNYYSSAEDTIYIPQSSGIHQVILLVQDSAKSCADADTMSFEVFPQPALELTNDTTICRYDQVQLQATGGVNYQWAPAASLSCTNCPNPLATPPSSTTYTVTATNSQGCEAVDSVTLSTTCCINSQPGPIAGFVTNDSSYCLGDTVIFTNQSFASSQATYTWNFGPDANPSSSGQENPPPVIFTEDGAQDVTLIVQDTCASDTLTKTVNVFPQPLAKSIDTALCPVQGDSVRIGEAGIAYFDYKWRPPDGLGQPNRPTTPLSLSDTTVTYLRTKTNTNTGCSAVDTVSVELLPQPDAVAETDTTITLGHSVQLEGCCGNDYTWTPSSSLDDASTAKPVAQPEQTTTYTMSVGNQFGCNATDTVLVEVDRAINFYIPNMFSPNGDGSNDRFKAYSNGEIEEIHLQLYNRWGELVYEAQSVEEALNKGWDGTWKGEDQPSGTYVWKLKGAFVNGDDLQYNGKQKGTLLLVR